MITRLRMPKPPVAVASEKSRPNNARGLFWVPLSEGYGGIVSPFSGPPFVATVRNAAATLTDMTIYIDPETSECIEPFMGLARLEGDFGTVCEVERWMTNWVDAGFLVQPPESYAFGREYVVLGTGYSGPVAVYASLGTLELSCIYRGTTYGPITLTIAAAP